MKRISLLLLALINIPAADVVTVNPDGTVIVAGTAAMTAPAAGEVRMTAGRVATGAAFESWLGGLVQGTWAADSLGPFLRWRQAGKNFTIYDEAGGAQVRVTKTSTTFAGPVIAPAATTAAPSIRLPPGTAPSAPVNGDLWTTSTGLYARINGATVGPMGAGGGSSFYGKITNSTTLTIDEAADPATINRMHVISDKDPLNRVDFTIALPAAAGNSGNVIGFTVKDYANAARQYTLDTTVTGVSIAGRPQKLVLVHSNVVLLMSDGTNWLPLVLNLDTPWVTAPGGLQITATTTNPTKATTPIIDTVRWARVGASLSVIYNYYSTGTSGNTSGSGDYLFAIPIGTIDAPVETGADSELVRASMGYGQFRARTAGDPASKMLSFGPYDTTRLRASELENTVASGYKPLGSSSVRYMGTVTLPIKDW